jgi:glycosyltransferase involved in cell wall biosynthesis
MLGWEFPPFISGGLGTACYGLTKAMNDIGLEVIFALPKPVDSSFSTHVKMLSPQMIKTRSGQQTHTSSFEYDEFSNVKFMAIDSLLRPYSRPEQFEREFEELIRQKRLAGLSTSEAEWAQLQHEAEDQSSDYGGNMFHEIHRYSIASARLSIQEDFDVIHAHDWMTYPAGIAVAAITGKPLVIHVHSTEFDRSGEHVNQQIYDIERAGMHAADKIIAVSHLTRNIIIARYGIVGEKVEVVYNGVEPNENALPSLKKTGITKDEKIVLFLGRITMQKGPEYFLAAAKKVLDVVDNVKFVMAGSGDMMKRTIEMAAEM